MNIKNAANIAVMKYAVLFHAYILAPSKFHNGIMLNKASHALIIYPEIIISFHIPVMFRNNNGISITASTIFVNGPARLIIPFCFFVMFPNIITAPGAMKTNPKKLIITASTSIVVSALNSAQQ